MSDAPERIWGGVYTSEITTYKPFHSAVGYVREDLYEAAQADNARLREALATVASWGDGQTASERSMQRIARAAIQETDK